MNKKYIYTHLGLGDHIICNGLLRKIISQDFEYLIFAKKHNYESVRFMLKDLSNVTIISVQDDNEAKKIINENNNECIKVGHEFLKGIIDFDVQFYNQMNVNFSERWESFYVERDFKKEEDLYNKLNPNNEKYIFVHDDVERNYKINSQFNKKVIKPIKGLTDNIFDYLKIIENAEEIHCIDSSFRMIIDSLKIEDKKLYFHTYSRGNMPLAKSRLNWILC